MAGIVCGVLAVPLLGLAARDAWREMAFQRVAVETVGRIVALEEATSRDSKGHWSVSYFPVFQYALPDGTVLQRRARAGSNPPHYAVGETVRVRYEPARPREAELTSFMQTWFSSVLFGTLGVLIGLAGVIMGRDMARSPVRVAGPAAPPKLSLTATLAGLRREETPEGPRWIVLARWRAQAEAKPVVFESAPLPFDPAPQMRGMTTVKVWMGPGTPNGHYAMDLSFLRVPEAAEAQAPGAPAGHG